MAHAPPPPPQYHRLIHGRGIHNRTSPDPSPSARTKKVLDALEMAKKVSAAVGCVGLFGCAIYMHFGLKTKLKKMSDMLEDLSGKSIDSQIKDASSVSPQTLTAPASGDGKGQS